MGMESNDDFSRGGVKQKNGACTWTITKSEDVER